jgi:3-deoxy-D-arabino-heptulosonate 7-phosphate (DAHP) synthase class II
MVKSAVRNSVQANQMAQSVAGQQPAVWAQPAAPARRVLGQRDPAARVGEHRAVALGGRVGGQAVHANKRDFVRARPLGPNSNWGALFP